jgi:hypothetical protein
MRTLLLIATLAAAAVPAAALADRLGEHPAVVVQRLHASAGYDYASKFYPHPAWLHLSLRAPGEPTAEQLLAAQRAAHIDSSDPPAQPRQPLIAAKK